MTPPLPSLYEVSIGHSRSEPVRNSFLYRSYMWLFDLADPPCRRLGRWRPEDHLDVRPLLAACGLHPERIVVLTGLAVFGYVFNPITLYWCYGPGGRLTGRVVEVHNTYGGRHAYVIPGTDERAVLAKEMYVSPFYPVDGEYSIDAPEPTEHLRLNVTLHRQGQRALRAWVHGTRRPATGGSLLGLALKYPLAPVRNRALIQWQGLRLWARGLVIQPRHTS